MSWFVTEQARRAAKHALEHDDLVLYAFESLWEGIRANPLRAGHAMSVLASAAALDKSLERVERVLKELGDAVPSNPGARLSVRHVPSPSKAMPPDWLAFAIHVPDWAPPTRSSCRHTLLALGLIDRKDRPYSRVL